MGSFRESLDLFIAEEIEDSLRVICKSLIKTMIIFVKIMQKQAVNTKTL